MHIYNTKNMSRRDLYEWCGGKRSINLAANVVLILSLLEAYFKIKLGFSLRY